MRFALCALRYADSVSSDERPASAVLHLHIKGATIIFNVYPVHVIVLCNQYRIEHPASGLFNLFRLNLEH